MASKGGKTTGGRARKKHANTLARQTGIWEQLPLRTRHLIALGFLVIVGAVFFAPATFQGLELVGSDTLQSHAMAKSIYDYKAETGEDALWATNLFSGMPGYMISYPKVAVQLDVVTSWFRRHLWPPVQFLILLVGVYTLVYFLTSNSLAALIASLGAGLTTYIPIILAVGHTSKFIAISWVPWLMVAFLYTLRNPRLICAPAFALLLALELRAGHPQITYYAAWLLGLWWATELVGAVRQGNLREFGYATGFLGLGTMLAVLMVAQPYWAQFEYKQFSTRGGVSGATGGESTGLAWDYAMSWSQGKLELLTLLIADIFGGGSGSGSYWGAKPFTEGPHYLGGVTIFLALVAAIGRREAVVRGLTLGVIVLTLFSIGNNFTWFNRLFFDYIPMFSSFRAPEMWLHLVELSLAILAGLGAAYMVRRENSQERKRNVLVALGCVFGLSLFLTLGGESLLSFERPGEGVQAARQLAARESLSPSDPVVQQAVDQYLVNVKASRQDLFRRDAIRTVLILVITGVLIWLYFNGRVKAWSMLSILALLVLFDLWGVGKRHLTDASYREGRVGEQIELYGFDRFIVERIEEVGGAGHFRTLSLENSPVNWARPAFYYETSGGYNAAKLQVYQDFIDNVFFDPTTGLPTGIGLDLTATRYVIFGRPLPGTRLAYSDPTSGMAVLERENPAPRTRFVGAFQVVSRAEQTFAAINKVGFDPREEAVLLIDPGIESASVDSSSTVDVSLLSFGPHEIIWEVSTDKPRLLVTSEVYYPAGWKAFVDETEAPILQTDHAFRSLVVPPGKHRVRMVFDPESHRISSWVSIVSTIFVYGWVVLFIGVALFRRRKNHD